VGYSQKLGVRDWSGFGWQILLLTPPGLLYFFVRDLSAGQERAAFANAASIVDLQKSLGLDWESTLQQRILDTNWIVSVMNWVYIYGHFPVILGSLVLLFGMSRRNFITLRNALVVSGTIGLVCFALYPVAPPRLFDPTVFFDSLGELSSSYQVLQNPKVTNQFAAVPSFHVGWNVLVAIAVFRASSFRLLRLVAVAFPLLMMAAVILTANHWLLDIVAGLSVAFIGIVGAKLLDRLAHRFVPVPLAADLSCAAGTLPRKPPERARLVQQIIH
jgi:membrane-associated phospholipid phosphatase